MPLRKRAGQDAARHPPALLNIIFWILVAIDALALGLFFILGLAAAGPSHTSPFAVAALMLIPAVILLACATVFLRTDSTGWRVGAMILAASPVLFVAAGSGFAGWDLRGYRNANGSWNSFKAGPLRDLEAAITNRDLPAVASAAKQANLNQTGLAGATPLLLAIRQLEKHPTQLDILRTLLEAGANPNGTGDSELPLVAAIYVSRHAGLEPVRVLLKAGAQPNLRGTYGTPAYFAATGNTVDVEVLRFLLDSGADLRTTDSKGEGPLIGATNASNWKAVLLMLERGADWRKVKTLDGHGLLHRLESDAQLFGDGKGLAEVIRFVKASEGR